MASFSMGSAETRASCLEEGSTWAQGGSEEAGTASVRDTQSWDTEVLLLFFLSFFLV